MGTIIKRCSVSKILHIKESNRSPLGEVRDGVAHNGTDIDTLKVQREIYAPSQGIIVSVQDGYLL